MGFLSRPFTNHRTAAEGGGGGGFLCLLTTTSTRFKGTWTLAE